MAAPMRSVRIDPAADPGDGGPLSPLSPLSPAGRSARSAATSGRYFAEPTQTLAFFDWDDTLFPTTSIMKRWSMPSDPDDKVAMSNEEKEELGVYGDLLNQFLCLMCGLSERVVVITNSRRPWVEDCVRHFVPQIQPLMDRDSGGLHVVYAREVYGEIKAKSRTGAASGVMFESEGETREEKIEEYTAWKYAAMKQEASQFYAQYPGQTWKNILSFGDMPYEHYAIEELDFKRKGPQRECLRIKSYVVVSGMSITWFIKYLQLILVLAPILVQYDGDFRMGVEAAHLSAMDRMALIGEQLGIQDFASIVMQDVPWAVAHDPRNYLTTTHGFDNLQDNLADLVVALQDSIVD